MEAARVGGVPVLGAKIALPTIWAAPIPLRKQ